MIMNHRTYKIQRCTTMRIKVIANEDLPSVHARIARASPMSARSATVTTSCGVSSTNSMWRPSPLLLATVQTAAYAIKNA